LHHTTLANINNQKYAQDKIATPKMVDLSCSKIHPKIATVVVDLTEARKENQTSTTTP
jgi:hypothetical protein